MIIKTSVKYTRATKATGFQCEILDTREISPNEFELLLTLSSTPETEQLLIRDIDNNLFIRQIQANHNDTERIITEYTPC